LNDADGGVTGDDFPEQDAVDLGIDGGKRQVTDSIVSQGWGWKPVVAGERLGQGA